ncbi:MAG: hypothetical protein EHM85_01980 [Desulfobacteraceae bacterium]|nr:MAG: hypothetical protein EHM85_01980 [Desulfobacteraceae bacterium]
MKKWTKNDEQFLKDNYNILTNVELYNYFKISKGTFTKKARELGLKRKTKWSKNKEKYLLKYIGKKSLNELAKILDVSVGLIRQKKFQMGLTNTQADANWTKEKIIAEINGLININEDISAGRIKKAYPSLYSMARNYYRSWQDTIKACGIDYNTVRKNSHEVSWSRGKVIEDIRVLFENNQNLSSKYNCINRKRLWNAANHYFFSWRNAIEGAGLDYNKLSKNILNWNPVKVKKEILKLYQNDFPLFASYAKKNYVQLYGAARTHFSNWKEAIEYSDLDYSEINKRANEIDWTPSLIKETLLSLKEKNEDMSESVILRKYSKLRTGARRIFGSWEKAVEYSGLDINKTRKDIDTEGYKGRIFEDLVYKVLISIGRNISRQSHININNKIYIPDFIDNDSGSWIDSKLSSWGVGVEETIKKYLNVQDELEIIYLKSGPRKMEKVNFTWIKNFFPKLRVEGHFDLIEQINSIK